LFFVALTTLRGEPQKNLWADQKFVSLLLWMSVGAACGGDSLRYTLLS
jgi:hypothetical protein